MKFNLPRYRLELHAEIVAQTLPQAIERFARLFRPRVRANVKVNALYAGAYRGSWFAIEQSKRKTPPERRIDLGVALRRRKKLKRRPWAAGGIR